MDPRSTVAPRLSTVFAASVVSRSLSEPARSEPPNTSTRRGGRAVWVMAVPSSVEASRLQKARGYGRAWGSRRGVGGNAQADVRGADAVEQPALALVDGWLAGDEARLGAQAEAGGA